MKMDSWLLIISHLIIAFNVFSEFVTHDRKHVVYKYLINFIPFNDRMQNDN